MNLCVKECVSVQNREYEKGKDDPALKKEEKERRERKKERKEGRKEGKEKYR